MLSNVQKKRKKTCRVIVVQCKKKVSWTMKVNRKVNPGTEMVTCLKVFFNEFN